MSTLKRPLHILIVPPEEFIPPQSPVSAIFQFHQGLALHQLGHQVGVISVTPSLALKPLLVSLFRKITGKQTFYRQIKGASVLGIFIAIIKSLILPGASGSENINGLTVVRRRMFCWSDSTPKEELNYYKKVVESAFDIYIKKHGRPDIVHVHNAWLAGTASADLLRSVDIPFCLTEHSTYYARNIIPEEFFPLLRKVYSAAAARIAVSPSLMKMLIDLQLATDIKFIPNILDPLFTEPLPDVEKDRGIFTFFNVAELTEKKGHSILLRAFASAFGGNKNIRLIIGGSGDLMDELKALCFSLKIDGQVQFTGMLDRESLRSKMILADVFVLPSLFETFGVVVIEAMSCGKPVIATSCGGPENILDESSGVLVAPGDIAALSNAMIDMQINAASYDAAIIRSKALDHYGPEVVAKSIEAVYADILDRQAHAAMN